VVKAIDRVVQRYFVYRSLYVGYFRSEVPERLGLAIASEVMRLSFALAGASLFALILGALTLQALTRPGFSGWAILFGLLAAPALGAAVVTTRSLGTAVRALRQHQQLLKK
jgi:ABC-type spermidine/putrescine transport system permease subunit II